MHEWRNSKQQWHKIIKITTLKVQKKFYMIFLREIALLNIMIILIASGT